MLSVGQGHGRQHGDRGGRWGGRFASHPTFAPVVPWMSPVIYIDGRAVSREDFLKLLYWFLTSPSSPRNSGAAQAALVSGVNETRKDRIMSFFNRIQAPQARVGRRVGQTMTMDGSLANALAAASQGGQLARVYSPQGQYMEVQGKVEALISNPEAALAPMATVGTYSGEICGFIERCKTIAGCSTAVVKLKSRKPVQILKLRVRGRDADDLFIRRIISGSNILTSGDGFSAEALKGGKNNRDFNIDFAGIAFDWFNPLEFEVENLSEEERDFHVIVKVCQLVP